MKEYEELFKEQSELLENFHKNANFGFRVKTIMRLQEINFSLIRLAQKQHDNRSKDIATCFRDLRKTK